MMYVVEPAWLWEIRNRKGTESSHDVRPTYPKPPQLHCICIRSEMCPTMLKLNHLSTSDQISSSSDFKNMAMLLLLLLLPMALGQTTLAGTEVKVTTVTHRPFIMPNNLSSGERWPKKSHHFICCLLIRYEGFLVDMLKELSTMLGFTFNIHENPDKKYGQNNGGTWNGMIGEVAFFP